MSIGIPCHIQIYKLYNFLPTNSSFYFGKFPSRETGFECLGSWPGRDQTESYIGFLETGPDTSGPKYRCGVG